MHSTSFADNLRSVRDETVETVMKHFFKEHPAVQRKKSSSASSCSSVKTKEDIQCEEELMEAFGK